MQPRRLSLNRSTFRNILKDLDNTLMEVTVPKIAITTEAELTLYGEDFNYVNGEPVARSRYNLEEVYLPISKVIDIYHSGASVYVSNDDRLIKIAKKVSNVLDDLEAIHNRPQEVDDVIEYIEDFYTAVLKQKRNKLVKAEENFDKPKVLGLGGETIGVYDKVGNVNIGRINIDDITV